MQHPSFTTCYDLVGVGIGPFNMSLAALLSPLTHVNSLFFDQKQRFIWHDGMLLPESQLQVSFLKDLVTLVDPTNPYSFLAFLAKKKRLYQFLNAHFTHIYRAEFSQYLDWVSQALPNLQFGEKVEAIEFVDDTFRVHTDKRRVAGKNIVLGSGIAPHIPAWAVGKTGQNLYHNHEFMHRSQQWHNKRVAVVGGGQSSAEIIQSILADSANLPQTLHWISRRNQFLPMDDSPFVNELFIPSYSQHFYDLPHGLRQRKLKEQKLASDGISMSLLQNIYQRLYKLKLVDGLPLDIRLLPEHEVKQLQQTDTGYTINCHNLSLSHQRNIEVDIVILCTGYQAMVPNYLSQLAPNLIWEGQDFKVNKDYSIVWQGPSGNRIYVQNAAKHSHGIADPNLSLMAWRSAVIINSLLGEQIYDTAQENSVLDWQAIYPLHQPTEELLCDE